MERGTPTDWRMRAAYAVILAQIVGSACEAEAPSAADRQSIARCLAIPADDRRLACYDALANGVERSLEPAVAGAIPSKAPPGSTSPNPPKADDEKLFGLTKPLEPVARGPESLRAKIKQISADSVGNVAVILDNDQTWTLNDANTLLRRDDTVVINRAALGSFIMTTPTKRTYRVKRIR